MKKTRKSRSLEERFWEKVEVRGEDECWLWKASFQKGYGQIGVKGQSFPEKAHRVSWIIHFGGIPKSMSVLHDCDTPACVNPKHLSLGTQADNLKDMTWKGRRRHGGAFGERNKSSKLSEERVRKIRHLVSQGEKHYRIAKQFGVSRPAISAIIRGETWAWVK